MDRQPSRNLPRPVRFHQEHTRGRWFGAIWTPITVSANCPNGQERGNVVVTIGGHIDYTVLTMAPGDGSEDRKAVCANRQNIGFQFTACSTHMSFNRTIANQQTDGAFDWWTTNYDTWFNIFAGDFNVNHTSSTATNQWFFTHDEMHLLAEPVTYNPGQEKIDFVFADRRKFFKYQHAPCNNYPSWSDHRYCFGQFVV